MIRAVVGGASQRGAVLITGLIMLLLVTLMVVAGFNMTQTNMQAAQNMESRRLAMSAASSALEEAISSGRFTDADQPIFLNFCAATNKKCFDVNADGIDDVEVTVAEPVCIIVLPIKNSELNLSDSSEASCFIQDAEYSLCSNSVWELLATAVDSLTGAQSVVRQGVGIRVASNDIDTACPI